MIVTALKQRRLTT